MPLPHEDVREVNTIAPSPVQFLQRLDRADRDRSRVGAEAQQNRTVAMRRQAPRAAVGPGQLEVRRQGAEVQAHAGNRLHRVRQQVLVRK